MNLPLRVLGCQSTAFQAVYDIFEELEVPVVGVCDAVQKGDDERGERCVIEDPSRLSAWFN